MIRNSIWSFIGTIGGQLVAMVGNIILARLLFPELFGLLGMATLFSGLILVIQEAGFSGYIIYKKGLNKDFITTSFWLNIVMSFILSGLFYLCSGLIADFFNRPELRNIIALLCIGMIFSSLSITSRAVLTKEKKFNILAMVDIIAQVISTIVAIVLAVLDQYYLAITARFIVLPIIQSAIFLSIEYKFVFGSFKWKTVQEMVPYSSRVLGTNISIYFNNNLDYLMIGKLLGSRQLGLYTIAYQWSVMARYYISGSINKVLFPEISSINTNLEQVKKIFLDVTNTVSFITFPLCFGLSAICSDFIYLFYGDQWSDSIAVLKILLIAGAVTSIGTLSGSLFQGLGKPQIEFRFNIMSFIMNVIFIYIGSNSGLVGVATAIIIASLILECYKMFLISKLLQISFIEYLISFMSNLVSSVLMFISVFLFNEYVAQNIESLIRIVLAAFIGGLVYIIFSILLNKSKVREAALLIKRRLFKVKNSIHSRS